MKLNATETQSYAQPQPHLPHISVVKGKEYEVGPGKGKIPEAMAKRIVELDGGKLVTPRNTGGDLKKAVKSAKQKVTGMTTKLTKLNESLADLKDEAKTKAEAGITELEGKLETAKTELADAETAADAED